MSRARASLPTSASSGRRELHTGSWLAAEKCVGLLNGAVAGVFVARQLGPNLLARVSLFTALVYLATPFITAVQPFMVIALGRGMAEQAVLTSGRRLSRRAALWGTAAAFLSLLFLRSSLLSRGTLVAGGLLLLTLLVRPEATAEVVFQHELRLASLTRRRILVSLCAAAMRIAVAATSRSAVGILLVYAGEQFGLILVVRLNRRIRLSRNNGARVDHRLVAEWRRGLIPTFVASAGVMIYMRTDQILLGHFVAGGQVGQYAAAATLAETPYFVSTVATTVLAPRLTRLFHAGSPEYADLFRLLNRLAAAAGLLVVAATWLTAGFVVRHLYGPAYADTTEYVRILSLATPFVFLGVVQSTDALLRGQQRLVMARTCAAGLVNVGINLALLASCGTITAAWTTVLAQAMSAWLLNAASPVSRGVFKVQSRALSLMWVPGVLSARNVRAG